MQNHPPAEGSTQFDRLAFLDEYGDTSLAVEKSGVTTYYIIAAVVVSPEDADCVRTSLRSVSAAHFSGREMKSSAIGKNDARRIKVLEKLVGLPYHVHIQAVDKSRLAQDSGLIYKKSFIKYLHGRLYQSLFRAHPSLSLTLDEHGSREFMDSFERYIHANHVTSDLFSNYDVSFARSDTDPILQLADLIAGSLARIFDPKKMSENGHRILNLLSGRILTLEHWPPRLRGYIAVPETSDEMDAKVALLARRSALEYLESHYDSTHPDITLRVEVLRYLLYRLDVQTSGTYVSTRDILNVVAETTGENYTEIYLRANVIGPLRDAGMLIISGSSGYKIADCSGDVQLFVSEVARRVSPQLKRIGTMRDMIRSTTLDELDIFDGEYSFMADAVEAIRKSS
ncbi:MAG: hypothetical protein RhofKO_35200 [Rhodothermales bacterium]